MMRSRVVVVVVTQLSLQWMCVVEGVVGVAAVTHEGAETGETHVPEVLAHNS